MEVRQFEDKGLAHYSYAIYSQCTDTVALVDPGRDIQPYLDYASEKGARIAHVIETHPHADFVSGHAELRQVTGATLYCSVQQQARYQHQAFDEGDSIEMGKITLRALNTPGHSPDSLSIVLQHEGKDKAVFTGDTLFIGDCGRPDLREQTADVSAKREELAKAMYHSLRDKLATLDDDVIVYPAHGAGSLCGKALSAAGQSTIAQEKQQNWSMQPMSEDEFVKALTEDQPFVPKYFTYDVSVNRTGAKPLEASLKEIEITHDLSGTENTLIVDTRTESEYQAGHLPGSIHIQDGGKFETWLGSVIAPNEPFILVAADEQSLVSALRKAAKIGYEAFLKKGLILSTAQEKKSLMPLEEFKRHPGSYTIIDVRNEPEHKARQIFEGAINIPLHQLRDRIAEVPKDKPIVVHCAGGTRSAAGSSILRKELPEDIDIFDLGSAVKNF